SEKDAPKGYVISAKGDIFELTEKTRKELVVWDISTDDKKMVWIMSTKEAYQSNSFMQLVKNVETAQYKVIKKCIIDPTYLNQLYDKKELISNQIKISSNSVVVGSFEIIIMDALLENVSDVHIEVRNNGGIIRMRKNGEMMEYNAASRYTFAEANNMCSVIYNVLANTKSVSFDPRNFQQAAVNYSVNDTELKLRYQSVPAYPDGYDVILRVLPVGRSEDFVPLQKLGYTEQQVSELTKITSRPIGSLIIAGVTGSGKSTTLKNLLMYVNANAGYKLKIYSIEDPPEYNIARITQIPVIPPKDSTQSPFEQPIKACMRGDPDIIMIGEVRDKITGDLTKKAIQSGHQVLTTVHATSAIGIIDRFQDFGLTPTVLGSPDFLTGLLYQKLMPLVCDNCAIDFVKLAESDEATKEDVEMYARIATATKGKVKNYKIKKRNEYGCPQCKEMGVKGRSVCAEVITVDLNMLQYISNGETIKLIHYWRSLSDGDVFSENMKGKTCMEHAFQKMLAGKVCPFDLEASFKPIDEIALAKATILMEHKKTKDNSHENDEVIETNEVSDDTEEKPNDWEAL
ncbi:MAG: hypothetical protein C0448_16065, partial [Sphingobacteriaceae bacterium]|nr:hypothetical protein [Sphingobacteriaceae bacterium]